MISVVNNNALKKETVHEKEAYLHVCEEFCLLNLSIIIPYLFFHGWLK